MPYFLFGISVISTVLAHLCFKKGVLKIGTIDFSLTSAPQTILHLMQNVWILAGGVLFVLSFLTWLSILSKLQLNVAYPVIISIEAVLVSLASWFIFHEYLSWMQILGIISIILGILLISPKGSL